MDVSTEWKHNSYSQCNMAWGRKKKKVERWVLDGLNFFFHIFCYWFSEYAFSFMILSDIRYFDGKPNVVFYLDA